MVVNADDENCLNLRSATEAKTVTFGIENDKSNFVARNITFDNNGFSKFDVYHNNNFYSEFRLSVPGIHNVLNALACISLCFEYGIDKYTLKSALLNEQNHCCEWRQQIGSPLRRRGNIPKSNRPL